MIACDTQATEAGVRGGMKPSLVRSLAADAVILQRDVAAEAAALDALACWAGAFTPRVCVVPQKGLLLEVGSCLTLFGGLDSLWGKVLAGIRAQGFVVRSAVAPVAQGALWLALVRDDMPRVDGPRLRPALDALPLCDLATVLTANVVERLESFGLQTLGEARRQPSAALTRRIGSLAMTRMARAYGELAEAQQEFVFPQQFVHGVELPAPIENAEALLFVAHRLVQAMTGWLGARQCGIQECSLLLLHHHRSPTAVVLRFGETQRDPVRIEWVLRERLQQLDLPAPVEAVRLEAKRVQPLPGRSAALLPGGAAQHDGMPALIERLRARMGEANVHGLMLEADHRPERNGRAAGSGKSGAAFAHVPRPLFLLATPQLLGEYDGRPQYDGPLLLLSDRERIESGWWDGGERDAEKTCSGDIRRDYFVALSPSQRWLWIYRECAVPGGWYLHGYFS